MLEANKLYTYDGICLSVTRVEQHKRQTSKTKKAQQTRAAIGKEQHRDQGTGEDEVDQQLKLEQ